MGGGALFLPFAFAGAREGVAEIRGLRGRLAEDGELLGGKEAYPHILYKLGRGVGTIPPPSASLGVRGLLGRRMGAGQISTRQSSHRPKSQKERKKGGAPDLFRPAPSVDARGDQRLSRTEEGGAGRVGGIGSISPRWKSIKNQKLRRLGC